MAEAKTTRLFTFRKNGKAHRAVEILDAGQTPGRGFITCTCTCPGSANGRLIQGSTFIAEGHAAANCGG
jgi:hypothetical protein